MNSRLTYNLKNENINWNKPQLIKKSNPAGIFIILSTGCRVQETTFEGIIVYSKNPNYKIGEYSSIWGKADAITCDQSEEIILSN